MLAPLDLDRISTALSSPMSWVELLVVAGCFAIGWTFDRRVRWKSASGAEFVRVGLGSVNRLLLPLVTLGLLLIAAAVFRRWAPPFFLTIAIPLAVALAVIRLLVYALREIFGAPTWIPWSERVISYTIWGIMLLHFIGVLPSLREELDAMEIPLGGEADLAVRAPEGRGRRDPDDLRHAMAVRPHRAEAAARRAHRQQRPRRRQQVAARGAARRRRADRFAGRRHRPDAAHRLRRRGGRGRRASACKSSPATTLPDSRSCSIARSGSATW